MTSEEIDQRMAICRICLVYGQRLSASKNLVRTGIAKDVENALKARAQSQIKDYAILLCGLLILSFLV